MANFFPLVANYSANIANGFVGNRIEELRPADTLSLDGSILGLANSRITNLAVGNIGILGGYAGQVLATDGNGVQYWSNGGSGGGTIMGVSSPLLQFDVSVSHPGGGNNLSFTDTNLLVYPSNTYASVYVNGVLQRVSDYVISGATLVMNQQLLPDDVVAVGPVGGTGSNSVPTLQFPIAGNLTPGNAQSFTDTRISYYSSNANAAVFVNGVLQRLEDYTIVGNILTINQFLDVDDVVAIGPSVGVSTGNDQILTTQVDPSNLGFTLTGGPITSNGTITLNVPNSAVLSNALGITGYPPLNGNANTYLNGNGVWTPVTAVAGNTTEVQFNNGGVLSSSPNLTFNGTNLSTNNVFERAAGISGSVIDLATGAYQVVTLTAATTFTVANVPAAPQVGSFIMHLSNAALNPPTFNFGINIKWVDGVAPTLTSSALTTDILGFYTLDSGTSWFGYVLGQDVA